MADQYLSNLKDNLVRPESSFMEIDSRPERKNLNFIHS